MIATCIGTHMVDGHGSESDFLVNHSRTKQPATPHAILRHLRRPSAHRIPAPPNVVIQSELTSTLATCAARLCGTVVATTGGIVRT